MTLKEIVETNLQLNEEQRKMAEGPSIMNIMPIEEILATGWNMAMAYVKANVDVGIE